MKDALRDIIITVYYLYIAQSMGEKKSILHHKTEGKFRKSWSEVRWKERVLSYEDETLKKTLVVHSEEYLPNAQLWALYIYPT